MCQGQTRDAAINSIGEYNENSFTPSGLLGVSIEQPRTQLLLLCCSIKSRGFPICLLSVRVHKCFIQCLSLDSADEALPPYELNSHRQIFFVALRGVFRGF